MPSRHYNAKKRRTFATEYEHLTSETMRAFNYFVAFLGGAAVGAACGVLFAPERGEDTRDRIVAALRKRGINLDRKQMNDLVDDIADELKSSDND